MSTFITNTGIKDLKKRLSQLISASEELKFLVGFFYFSGLHELYKTLKANDDVIIKILVGLDVDKTSRGLVETALLDEDDISNRDRINVFLQSVKKSINSEEFDTKQFYEEVSFFLKLIKNDQLVIRKTLNPNHAKLYIFNTNKEQIVEKVFITGSSNLTRAGLFGQEEFNVEIGGPAVTEAEEYFDQLWDTAVQITELKNVKQKLIEIIENETLVKEITPFQAFSLILKNYIDSYKHKDLNPSLLKLFKRNGYKPYRYQLDAIKQALTVIEENNGVILADVVGLGKTVMACAIAKELGQPGIIICPPGLKGDPTRSDDGGWHMYKRQFGLIDWEVWSSGELKKLQKEIQNMPQTKVVIIDEAHRFRNEDTQNYEYLKNICRGKKVILLTATPFNNRPSDILSLIKLFLSPKKSLITLDDNLANKFALFQGEFKRLSFILKNHNSSNPKHLEKAKKYYKALFNEDAIDTQKVKNRTRYLANRIRSIIEPITIRRNRIDLKRNPYYKKEIQELSKVADPKEWFYQLTKEQSQFYDKVIGKYFADPENGGQFKGAIYKPFVYEKGDFDPNKLGLEENREFQQQRNLYDFMRRLLVKRFESSFGAFEQSIKNFIRVTKSSLKFIRKTKKFILDRDLLEKLLEKDPEEIEAELLKYSQKLEKGNYPKNHKIYHLFNFKLKDAFIQDINSDLQLFSLILKELEKLDLINNDPKLETLIEKIKETLNQQPKAGEPKRKLVIFSEYTDTIKYLSPNLSEVFPNLLSISGNLNNATLKKIYENFDASYKDQKDDYDILLTSDKLSEGFNLNRAGIVVNYDIPWNPVRVIQRLGRINRISKKVFEELYIANFFPTEQGAKIIRSRQIAANKMFLIHNTLGEDAKIFAPDEEPKPAALYQKITSNPEELEEESFYTKALNHFEKIKKEHPDLIKSLNNMPPRVKVAKPANKDELFVFIRKNRQVYVRAVDYNQNYKVTETTLEEVFEKIICIPQTKALNWNTDSFWTAYKKALTYKPAPNLPVSEQSSERKALTVLETILGSNVLNYDSPLLKFVRNLKEDILSYGSLPTPTLRKISKLPIDNKTKLEKELHELANNMGGINYLQKEKAQFKNLQKEIIVAIKNQKVQT